MTVSSFLLRLSLLSSWAWLSACSGDDVVIPNDEPPADLCNSREEALSDTANCELVLGQSVSRYISFAGDQDWYSFRTPATTSARTLLHVSALYPVPSTAVNLSVNVLREDGQQSLARAIDAHGQAAPSPLSIVRPFAEPNTRLLLLLADQPTNPSKPNFDVKSPYLVTVNVLEDPDVYEPNDTTPTPLTLAAAAGIRSVSVQGYLSVENDVDRFSFQVTGSDQVAYLKLSADRRSPPPPFRLSYSLLAPDGSKIAEGRVATEVTAVDLATARLVQSGTYTVVVQGYRPANVTAPIPGDPTHPYALEVKVMDEVDVSEPNDTLLTAKNQALANTGASHNFTGRLGYVPDPDWFSVTLTAAQTKPTLLRYKLVPAADSVTGRFAPLPGLIDRQVRVLTEVTTGATLPDRRANCTVNAAVCPKGYSENAGMEGLVEELCAGGDRALCLQSLRVEEPTFAALKNFEGVLQVPPHGGNLRYYLLVQDEQNSWADDRDYRLEVSWVADADEANNHNGTSELVRAHTLGSDATPGSYPVPPSGASFEFTGSISHGFGRLKDNDRERGLGVRGPNDYDAIPSDKDTFEFTFPVRSDPQDLGWELQWVVEHPSGSSSAPHALVLDLSFCDGVVSPSTCSEVKTGAGGGPLTLSYDGGNRTAWHLPASSVEQQPIYQRQVSPGETTVTLLPFACACFEPRFVKGKTFRITVSGAERMSYAPVNYRLKTAWTNYPQTFTSGSSTLSCPAPVNPMPGCRFTAGQ